MGKIKRRISSSNDDNMEDLFDHLTPEVCEEMRLKRLERIKNMSTELQLGLYVGEYIVNRYLPTLSTDMLQSRKVINVSEEDTTEFNKLSDDWWRKTNDKSIDESITKEAWNVHLKNMYYLQNKYLPHVLECYLSPLNIINIDDFKRGIKLSLWNCDMCSYKCDKDDIEIINDDNGYNTIIKLKLDTHENI